MGRTKEREGPSAKESAAHALSAEPASRSIHAPQHLGKEYLHTGVQSCESQYQYGAISASPVAGTVTVEWSHRKLATCPALCTIMRDEGPGFTAQQRLQAFQPLFTTKANGTGLGLAIARRIIESHGGKIEIEGDSHTGGVLVVTLTQRRRT